MFKSGCDPVECMTSPVARASCRPVIGVDGLRRDLPVWTPGLLPFFQNAATSVRPALLDIFDRFYVPLNADLRPVTHALLLSLLPGLEEESSEFFDRVVRLLDQIAAEMGVSDKTVSNYQTLIRQKLGVNTAVELMRYGQAHGLIP